MRTQTYALALLAGSAISGQGVALEASGTTVAVIPDAQAGGSSGMRTLKIQGPIYMGDVITTDLKGLVQIIFVDDTRFVVGANSKVIIDAFVFDSSKTAQDVSISAVKGAFRFITGKSPKNNYAIKTPTMTIGVRGTAFDLAVRPGSGESTVVVSEGATNLCDAIHRCMEAGTGSMTVGSADGLRSVPAGGQELKQRIDAFFPLIQSQIDLVPGFVVAIPAPVQGNTPGGEPRHSVTGDPHTVEPQTPVHTPPPNGRPPTP